MKLLLVTSRYPWPPRRGDQVRAAQFAELLSRDHQLTLLVPQPSSGQEAPPAAASVVTYRRSRVPRLGAVLGALAGSIPLQAAAFDQADLRRKLRRLAPQADLVILQLVRLVAHLPDLGPTPFAVDLIDALSLNFRRRAALDRSFLRPCWELEARRLAAAEAALLARACRGWVVCERDRKALVRALPPETASRLEVLPLAIPLRAAASSRALEDPPGAEVPRAAQASRPQLAMTGNLGYFPAVEGFSWWLEEVWPRLRSRRPELRVVVAGSRPAGRLRRAANRPGVRLVESPADLRAELAAATLALAPLRCGSGQPIKILEAWECGVPVIASSWAAAGTAATAGKEFLVADSPEDWERQVLRLLDDPEEGLRLSAAGRRCLRASYAREVVGGRLLDSLEGLSKAAATP